MKTKFDIKIQELCNSYFIKEIIRNEWKPYLVGGCVRDYIMGKQPNDIDLIIVGCDKNELINLLNKYGKSDLVGESFAVIKYNYNGEIYDISTPRTESKIGDGHKGFEIISNKNISLEMDLFRRDITINSIAMDLDKNFIDPFNGINDIKNKIIKITNKDAFIDDPLRILRVCRFCSRFDFNIEYNTDILMKQLSLKINELSQERIIDEWYKTMEHAKKGGVGIMQKYVNLLFKYNMIEQMFPELKHVKKITVDILENSIIFLDLFAPEIIKSSKHKFNNLKFSNNLINEMIFLQEFSLNGGEIDSVYNLALLKQKYNINNILIAQYVEHINNIFGKDSFDENFTSSFLKYCDDGFEVKGDDLIKKGFKGYQIQLEKERLENERFRNKYY